MVARSLPVRTPGVLTLQSLETELLPGWWVILNLAGYQAGWIATVYGATHDMPWLGPLSVSLFVATHLLLSARPLHSTGLILIVLAYGAMQESVMLRLELVAYPTSPGSIPFWMLALWALFATTLSVSLRWFQTRPLIAALTGAVLGPLAYWAGAAAGAITLPTLSLSLSSLVLAWMVGFPLLLQVARRLEFPLVKVS